MDGCTAGTDPRATPIVVESGGSFSAGDDLETDAQSRAVAHSSGEVVAQAMEGATNGVSFWADFT